MPLFVKIFKQIINKKLTTLLAIFDKRPPKSIINFLILFIMATIQSSRSLYKMECIRKNK